MPPKRSAGSFSAPSGDGGPKAMGIQEIMPFVQQQAIINTLQQKQKGTQSTMPNGVPTQATDSLGVKYESGQGQMMEAQGGLRGKALDNAKSAALALQILNQSEGKYRKIFGDILDKGGPEGQAEMAKRYTVGVIGKQDPELTALVSDLPNQVSFFQRASQESGNIALQKEIRGGKALPILTPNTHPDNLFMPDDPKTGLAKFQWMRDQFNNIFQQSMDQYKTGQVTAPELNTDTPSTSSPIPGMGSTGQSKPAPAMQASQNPSIQIPQGPGGSQPTFLNQQQLQAQNTGVDINKHRQMAQDAIQKGADAKKVGAMFKQETGQDYNG